MPDYAAYGLTLRLPFPCPSLPSARAGALPDVTVTDGFVPSRLDAPSAESMAWQAEPGRFLWLGGRRAGRFLVEYGRCVTLQRGEAAEDDLLAFYFLDAVLAAILRQRGMLVLHANSAITPTGAVAISGESGSGKSTTLAALLAIGAADAKAPVCSMLADDITALRLGACGRIEALPGVPRLHLCEDAADGLGQDISHLPRYRWRRMKAAVPVSLATEPAPLRGLYLLRVGTGDGLDLRALTGAEKFAAVQECVYGPVLPQEHPDHFPLFAAVAEQVAVFRLERPANRWTPAAIAKVILHG